MANGDTNPSRLGQVNGSGDARALFLKVFGGEVLKTFLNKTIMFDLIRKRVLKHGKTAQFPVIGDAAASFHAAGEDMLDSGNSYLNNIKHNEATINADEFLVAPVFIADIDEALNHYEVRAEYSERLGKALAIQYDKYALQKVVHAARSSANITGGDAGLAITDADADTNAASLIDSIMQARQSMLEHNINDIDNVVCVVKPAVEKILMYDGVNNSNLFHFDKDIGGEGSFAAGMLGRIGGIKVMVSNNLPTTDLSSAITGDNNDYSHDFSTTVAAVFHKDAIGGVVWQEIKTEMERKATHLGWFVNAYLLCGFGVLRPEAAVEIKTA